MSSEQLSHFETLGKKFHKSFDVSKGDVYAAPEYKVEESLASLVEDLKAGLHPTCLRKEEQCLLQAGYGEEWYTKFGYTQSDMNQPLFP